MELPLQQWTKYFSRSHIKTKLNKKVKKVLGLVSETSVFPWKSYGGARELLWRSWVPETPLSPGFFKENRSYLKPFESEAEETEILLDLSKSVKLIDDKTALLKQQFRGAFTKFIFHIQFSLVIFALELANEKFVRELWNQKSAIFMRFEIGNF